MFKLILTLPFNICIVLRRSFQSQQEAEQYTKKIPSGFVVTSASAVPDRAIEVPFL